MFIFFVGFFEYNKGFVNLFMLWLVVFGGWKGLMIFKFLVEIWVD